MRRLADLASCFVLSFFVRVGDNLRDKHNKKHGQAECKQPCKLPSYFYFCPVNHFDFQSIPSLHLTQQPFPGEQLHAPQERACIHFLNYCTPG